MLDIYRLNSSMKYWRLNPKMAEAIDLDNASEETQETMVKCVERFL